MKGEHIKEVSKTWSGKKHQNLSTLKMLNLNPILVNLHYSSVTKNLGMLHIKGSLYIKLKHRKQHTSRFTKLAFTKINKAYEEKAFMHVKIKATPIRTRMMIIVSTLTYSKTYSIYNIIWVYMLISIYSFAFKNVLPWSKRT